MKAKEPAMNAETKACRPAREGDRWNAAEGQTARVRLAVIKIVGALQEGGLCRLPLMG